MIADFRPPPESGPPLDWALAYARAGLPVFPVNARKQPLTGRGVHDATVDEPTIRGWWSGCPHAEPAWAVPADIVVVDIDVKSRDGYRDFAALGGDVADAIETPQATTPSGGRHLVFDACGVRYGNRVHLNGTATDTRSVGGYIVLPASGNGRRWTKGLSTPLAPAPAWLTIAAAPPETPAAAEARPFDGEATPYALAALESACEAIASAPNGAQNDTLHKECYSIGGLIAAGELEHEPAVSSLVQAAQRMPSFDPARPWRDLPKLVRKSVTDGMRAPRGTPSKEVPPEVAEMVARMFGQGAPVVSTPAPPRDDLLLVEWLRRDLPPRDFLLGNVLCTTSRWILYGETGVGKTLFAADLAGAVAAGASLLNWEGRRQSRVMYLDGELPAETFKERMELIADRYGEGLDLYGYSRDVLPEGDMPALNTPMGAAWLWHEVEAVKPDLVVFDSIMCLLGGSMSEEESWEPIKPLIRKLSARRIAQVWLHHTGHDTTKAFGTKTREWEMDTVVSLTKPPDGGDAIALEFKKARLRVPATKDEFQSRLIRREAAGWTEEGNLVTVKGKRSMDVENIKRAILAAYDRLADAAEASPGLDGYPVRKVREEAVREEVKNKGFLETGERGALTGTSRSHYRRAKIDLITSNMLIEDSCLIWRPAVIGMERRR